ncbi:ATP synthase F1 subunit epsilon [Ureaplasma diversum]|uniref:ATP synthase epsilon chain n=1 Tax=Ureaplasma diversum NCTC 246 TaxID=1188241 RepID=A0A084F1B4_9BACT|nr:ATP synthase F1 subunit epsilon [Ureaplasma diversum]KEZ24006.1 ATP synthase epsilon chain [Ureaplasma diversum NCTC 246]
MSKLTTLKIVTPQAQLYSEDVYSVEVKTSEGRIAILPDHNPLVSPIVNHVAYIRATPSSNRKPMILLEGIIYVEKHQVRVFCDYFIPLESVSVEGVQKELAQHQQDFEKTNDDKKRMQIKALIKQNEAVLAAYKDR